MNIELIKPDATGKYSPLLYKWLRKNPNYRGVFQLKKNRLDGGPTTPGEWRPADIWIGNDRDSGWIHGNSLGSIIGKNAPHGWALPIGDDYIEITTEFWSAYERIGRCAWDNDHGMHMIGDENRWHYIAGGRQRECQWCGRVFESDTLTTVKVEQRITWTEYRPSASATLLHPMGSMGEEVALLPSQGDFKC